MNLYELHENPEQLHGYHVSHRVPKIALEMARQSPELRYKLEPIIMKDPWSAYKYTYIVLRKRWPAAEPYIKKDPEAAVFYARFILKHPWPEAESYIMKDPWIALHYMVVLLRRPWPEAEPYIEKDKDAWQHYLNYRQDFIKKRKS